jgi:hypothetical protein
MEIPEAARQAMAAPGPATPEDAPGVRGQMATIVPPGVAEAQTVRTPRPIAEPYRTGVELGQAAFNAPSLDISPSTTAMDLAEQGLAEVYRKRPSEVPWGWDATYIPGEDVTRLMAQVDRYGLTQMQSAAGIGGGPPYNVGTGMCQFLDFDGTQLSLLDQDPVSIGNMGLLPLGGNTMVRLNLIGAYWFVEPPMFSHAIVTSAISACAGVVPGAGQATPYYMSGGVMTAGQAVAVENWYSATGAVGKHCGLLCVDGTISLEVLDC